MLPIFHGAAKKIETFRKVLIKLRSLQRGTEEIRLKSSLKANKSVNVKNSNIYLLNMNDE